jgi:oligoribonuclease
MKTYFFWLDCEMTGLNWDNDNLLEIAFIITDTNCTVIKEKEYVIHHSKNILDNMNDWCKEHHTASGLTQKVLESQNTYASVEHDITYILNCYNNSIFYIAGNSVYNDVAFIKKYMPSLMNFFHYRLLDVSSIKILGEEYYKTHYKKKK